MATNTREQLGRPDCIYCKGTLITRVIYTQRDGKTELYSQPIDAAIPRGWHNWQTEPCPRCAPPMSDVLRPL